MPSVLENIRALARRNRIAFTREASGWMWTNDLSEEDVRLVLLRASALFLDDEGRWRASGIDAKGDERAVILAFDGGLVIVTGFVEAR